MYQSSSIACADVFEPLLMLIGNLIFPERAFEKE